VDESEFDYVNVEMSGDDGGDSNDGDYVTFVMNLLDQNTYLDKASLKKLLETVEDYNDDAPEVTKSLTLPTKEEL
jgi:hypothetical protein